MTTLTMAEALGMALFCCLLGSTLELNSPQGLISGRTQRGVLGGVLGGEDGGPLGGVLGGGDKGLLGTGGGVPSGVLGGQNGLLGLGDGGLPQPLQGSQNLNLRFIKGSWKLVRGTELILNLKAAIVVNLQKPMPLAVTVDVNIVADLAITQDKPGDLKLVLKNCKKLVAGFKVKLPASVTNAVVKKMVNTAIQTILPKMLCPIFQGWISLINTQLQTLNERTFGLLGRIHTALSAMPTVSGEFSQLDLKDKSFPNVFLQWLLKLAKISLKTI